MGPVPQNYRCFKCHQTGHWIKDCTLGQGVVSICYAIVCIMRNYIILYVRNLFTRDFVFLLFNRSQLKSRRAQEYLKVLWCL